MERVNTRIPDIGSEGDTIAKDQKLAKVNELIQVCEDAVRAYHTAADGVREDQLKRILMGVADERAQFVSVLKTFIQQMGGDPEVGPSVTGALMRGWMNLDILITDHDSRAILAECERGEAYALSVYSGVLDSDLPVDLAHVVDYQYLGIQETRDRLNWLERQSTVVS